MIIDCLISEEGFEKRKLSVSQENERVGLSWGPFCKSDFNAGAQSCFDRINKMYRIGDKENPDNPVTCAWEVFPFPWNWRCLLNFCWGLFWKMIVV